MKIGVATRGLDQRTKREINRNGIRAFFSNRINIALQTSDPSSIIGELVQVMDYKGLTKEELVAIFDAQGPLVDFIDLYL